jgi:hypothetical protein
MELSYCRPAARLEQLDYTSLSPAFFDDAGKVLATALNSAGSKVLLRIAEARDQDGDGLPEEWETSSLEGQRAADARSHAPDVPPSSI